MRDKRIDVIDKAPDIFVYLRPGWRLDDAHCFGEDSMGDVKKTMKRVKPCLCAECLAFEAQVHAAQRE